MNDRKVLYIIGTQRGGSTIVGRVLGTLPGLAFSGEVRRLWERGIAPGRTCGCGDPIETCPVWAAVLEAVRGEGLDPALMQEWQTDAAPTVHSWRKARAALHAPRPEWSRTLTTYAAGMAATYEALARVYDAEVIIDASKLAADAALLTRLDGVTPYFLHLVRDPRGVVASELRRAASSTPSRLRETVYGSSAWALRHQGVSQLSKAVGPSRILRMRYEDFVARPSVAAERVQDFVGLERQPLPDGELHLPAVHTPGGPLPRRAVRLEEDERWHEELSSTERRLVTVLTRRWMRAYGYTTAG